MLLLKIILSRDWTKRATGKGRLNCESHHMVKARATTWSKRSNLSGSRRRAEEQTGVRNVSGKMLVVRIKQTDA